MEYDADDNNESASFMDRVKESPRTVSALIIILIVAAAIYAFSGNKNNQGNEQAAVTQESPTPESGEPTPAVTPAETTTPTGKTVEKTSTTKPVVALREVSQDDLKMATSKLPEGTKTDSAYVEVAQKGNGLTHLARRATTRYLSENNAGYTITNEHRIYIEDYVRKHLPKGHVAQNSSHEISFDLMKTAVEKAGQLNQKQLHNLTKYTHSLT